MKRYFPIKSLFTIFIFILLIFSSVNSSVSAQAPMTVFGVVPSSTATVKIFIDGTFCKDADILAEPNSSTGYIFLGYIDEGECSAFADSLISFNLNDQTSKETILWRKGGAPQSATGLVLNSSGSQNDTAESKQVANSSAEKKSLPTLPGPAEKPKDTSDSKDTKVVPEPEKNTDTVEQNKQNDSQPKEQQASAKQEDTKQPITKNTPQSQMEEKQTVIESNENDSGRNTLVFAGLATVLVLLGFYSLARR